MSALSSSSVLHIVKGNRATLMMIILVCAAMLMGGSSRADTLSLLLLRPLAIIIGAIAVMGLSIDALRQHRILFGLLAACFALVILHLIPLPPSIWTTLPDRQLVTALERAAGLSSAWRPLSLTPAHSWNALFALFIPAATLIIAAQMPREGLFRLLNVLLILGLGSALLGLVQMLGGPDAPAYLYRITNNGAPVGFLANANHHAAFLTCLFPMLAVYASARRSGDSPDKQRLRLSLALAFGGFLVPMLLMTGSRTGLLLSVLAIAAAFWLYRPLQAPAGGKKTSRLPLLAAVGAAILALVGAALWMTRATAIQRVLSANSAGEGRTEFWPVVADIAARHFPFGSGVGSFAEVYQIHEPTALLSPSYVNHAHNDWLEVAMTAGLPGLLILLVAIAAYVISVRRLAGQDGADGRDTQFGWLGAVIILIFALASISDYPLRTPALSAFAVIAAVWLARGAALQRTPTQKRHSA